LQIGRHANSRFLHCAASLVRWTAGIAARVLCRPETDLSQTASVASFQFQIRGGNGTTNALWIHILDASGCLQLATEECHHPRCTRLERFMRQAWGRRFALRGETIATASTAI
jgi:hypothetical protein